MSLYTLQKISQCFDGHDLHQKTIQEDEILFWQGAALDYVYYVISGEIRSERYLMEGRELVFYRGQMGSILCEESLYFDKYLYTGVATVDSTVLVIPQASFSQVSETNPEFTKQIIRCMAQRYESSLMSREILMIKSADQRLLAWLNFLMPNGETSIDLSQKMGTLASEIGLSRESIYRSFKKLEEQKLITRDHGSVTLIKQS